MSPTGRNTMMILDLRDVPEHCDTLADLVWNAWWREKGTSYAYIRARVDENLVDAGIPFALIAHEDGRFMDTASVIESDMDERPDLSPWVAAVWVEPEHRYAGIGTALVEAAARAAVEVRPGPVYLCARRTMAPFYERMGWRRIEENVADLDIYSRFDREPGDARSSPSTTGRD